MLEGERKSLVNRLNALRPLISRTDSSAKLISSESVGELCQMLQREYKLTEEDKIKIEMALRSFADREEELGNIIKTLQLYHDVEGVINNPTNRSFIVENEIETALEFARTIIGTINQIFRESELQSMSQIGMPLESMTRQVIERLETEESQPYLVSTPGLALKQ